MNTKSLAAPVPPNTRSRPVPAPAPLAMPIRAVTETPPVRHAWATPGRVRLGRGVAFGGAALLTGYATVQMWLAISVTRASFLQIGLLVFFAATFAVIAFAGSSAVAGLLLSRRRPRRAPAMHTEGRIALVMPLYNEEVAPSFAALAAMGEALCAAGAGERFEIFVLSDSQKPESFVRETAAFACLRARLRDRMPCWYRRRSDNRGRKAGNVADFVTRWGARYEAMLMLDADSLLGPQTILDLVAEMDAEPQLGIVQTVPRLAGGIGPFARMQQFASHAYGPIVGKGIDAWQGDDGNYWGHNALIRVRAFADACGLPELRGRAPFGGSILSHDFVEAAWIRRAGWAVRMRPELTESWEGSPPTLQDVAVRDRRWAQGNLQHLGVLRARGLRFSNRAHFVIGIFSYLASPLWLGLMLVGTVLAIAGAMTEPVYFGPGRQLFPDWPRFDSARMLWLFCFSIGLLLLPKLIGLGRLLASGSERRRYGGTGRILSSALAELVLSSCYAPIQMLTQTKQIQEILRGKDSGWSTQRREGAVERWRHVAARHGRHTAAGIALFVITWSTVPQLAAWLAPTIVGLLLAIPLARYSGDPRLGNALRRLGLFVTPVEHELPPTMQERDALVSEFAEAASVTPQDVLADPAAAARHYEAVEAPRPLRAGEAVPAPPLTARSKLATARDRAELARWLDERELAAVLGDEELGRAWRDVEPGPR